MALPVPAAAGLMEFLSLFPHKKVISLRHRQDRRARFQRQFISWRLDYARLGFEFAEGETFADSDGFPSKGARGCFMSHLRLLREASLRSEPTLICEDDLLFLQSRGHAASQLASAAQLVAWDMINPGPSVGGPAPSPGIRYLQGPIGCTHCYAVKPRFAARVVAYLEQSLTRESGHEDGGKIHVDGAFNDFRRKNPDVRTLVALPPVATQFPSRTDLGNTKWWDEMPMLQDMAEMARRLKTLRMR